MPGERCDKAGCENRRFGELSAGDVDEDSERKCAWKRRANGRWRAAFSSTTRQTVTISPFSSASGTNWLRRASPTPGGPADKRLERQNPPSKSETIGW